MLHARHSDATYRTHHGTHDRFVLRMPWYVAFRWN